MAEEFSNWDAAEHLRTREDTRLYLQACADEDPGDGSLIRAALNDLARAGNMAALARETGMSREDLYKGLSAEGSPTFATVVPIMRAGLQASHRVEVVRKTLQRPRKASLAWPSQAGQSAFLARDVPALALAGSTRSQPRPRIAGRDGVGVQSRQGDGDVLGQFRANRD